MTEETPIPNVIKPFRWAVQLGVATVVICAITGVLFHFTTRGLFARTEAPVITPVDPQLHVVSLEHGLAVYARNCAACHGEAGLGDGPTGAPLNPKPRNFSTGWFKLGSTQTGLPTEGDIVATVRRGMLPAAMPPWPHLSDEEVKSVAMAVRHLAIEARVSQKLARDSAYSREKARADAEKQLASGPKIQLPATPVSFDLKRGETFYLANCAACHDPDGRGKLRDDLVDNDDNPILARDFTKGEFKGGSSIEDIALRVMRGLPGTPMPGNPAIAAEDLWSTAAYVQSFYKGAASAKAPSGQNTTP